MSANSASQHDEGLDQLYALIGACITHKIGQRLFSLNWEQQRSEADFRANGTMPNKSPSMVASLLEKRHLLRHFSGKQVCLDRFGLTRGFLLDAG